jgi:hypothetical protein
MQSDNTNWQVICSWKRTIIHVLCFAVVLTARTQASHWAEQGSRPCDFRKGKLCLGLSNTEKMWTGVMYLGRGQLQVPASLLLVHTGQEAWWAPEAVWAQWWQEINPVPVSRPVASQFTEITYQPRSYMWNIMALAYFDDCRMLTL